ncbi:MAG: acyl carrier protein [Clostridiales bacterium]|nr:acyl carrier protein [Clostridiales bacterium]MCI7391986.1 acyl carrier protein [Clostridiales bacterium]MDD6764080.1 acyl carrier protein [Bacillota bacterium]MDD7131398.1 acyl carrier protein [Bacillota bacterium]
MEVIMVLDVIKGMIIDQLGVSEDELQLETNLMKDLEADSLDAVEIIMAIEDEYDIEIPDEDAERFQTIGDIVSYVEKAI